MVTMPLSTWAFRGNAPSTLRRFCASISASISSYRQPQRAGHEPVCLVPEWTSICLCLSGVFAQASTHILRASYSSDIATNTTSDFSSTCVVLALVAGRQDCQPRPNSQRQPLRLFLSSFRLRHFYITVNIASEMHSNACVSMHRAA